MRRGPSSMIDHPSLARVLRWMEDVAAPFVVFEGWPEAGRGWLMDGVARALGATDLDVDQLPSAVVPSAVMPSWYRWRGPDDPDLFRRLASWQGAAPGRQVLVRGPDDRSALPPSTVWLPPSMLLLSHEETLHWLTAHGLAQAPLSDRLAWWSGGWLGPLRRFHATWRASENPLWRDERLAQDHVAASIMAGRSRLEREILRLMATVGPLPSSTWRRAIEITGPEAARRTTPDSAVNRATASGSRLASTTSAASESNRGSPPTRYHGGEHQSWNGALRAVIGRWFPDARSADTLGLPPVLGDAAFGEPIDPAFAPVRTAWLTALASVLDAQGDVEGARRLRALGGQAAPGALSGAWRTPSIETRPVVALRLLGHGRADVVGEGQARHEVHWRLRRSFQAVAFLALATEWRASRAEIVEALWPMADPDVIRKNFHPVLSDARRTLRQAVGRADVEGIVYRQGTYRLDERIDWRIDVDVFERATQLTPDATASDPATAVDSSVLDTLLGAWRSYRGPLLDGFDEAWVSDRREALGRRYRALLRRIGATCAHLGRTTEALDAYRSALLEDPYDEPIHRAVMRLYGAQGRRDLVLVQFLRLQDHLKELNVEPRAETQQCYDRLMRADAVADEGVFES